MWSITCAISRLAYGIKTVSRKIKGAFAIMYVVTKDGKKLSVDDSSIDYENKYVPFQQTVGLYTDNTILKPVWVLELNTSRDDSGFVRRGEDFGLSVVGEIKYDHEPSKEEILWAMSANGLSRSDIVFIRQGFELDMEEEND